MQTLQGSEIVANGGYRCMYLVESNNKISKKIAEKLGATFNRSYNIYIKHLGGNTD